jgi:hypothetical protein
MRGSWSPKKARVRSSDRPFPSRPSENITSVADTRTVSDSLNCPCWNSSRTNGSASTIEMAAAGSSRNTIARMPRATIRASSTMLRTAAARESSGNSTVDTATENNPCGNMNRRNAYPRSPGADGLWCAAMIVSRVRLTLISPSPSETGTIRRRMCRTCGFPKPSRNASPIPEPRSSGNGIRNCTIVATSTPHAYTCARCSSEPLRP